MGHRDPFAMARDYEPVDGVGSFASGTPPVLALSALEAALVAFDGVSMAELRHRSLELTDLFIELVETRLPGVFEVVCSRDELELFARALETLPARCREIVMLRKLQGLSQQAIAERLGVSVNTVEVQLVRGMKRCDDYLRAHGLRRS